MSAEVWNVLANWVLALSAAGASVAAIRGLNTWKRQSEWDADADLARRLLIAIYKYRNSLFSVRHPAMSGKEMEVSEDEAEEINAPNARSKGIIAAYARRWDRHNKSSTALNALLIEADAIWGKELRELTAKAKELEHELYVYVMYYLDAHYRGGDPELRKAHGEILTGKRDILYDLMNDDDDEFRRDFKDALAPIEDYLRQKLGRKLT